MGAPATVWRAFERNEITHSAAHYLLAVAAFTASGRPPRSVDISRHLAVSRTAASLQLRNLHDQGLLKLDDAQRFHLTRAGTDLVARVTSKREVLRVFLSQVLGVAEETAEVDACKVEHLLSEETGAALVRLIRFLRSKRPAANTFLEEFRAAAAQCPNDGRCELCTNVCLMDLATRTGASSQRPKP
jgi:Mn-dependent DtxR family transcriptional regulator